MIRKNDTVVVLAGKDRGQKSKVLRVLPGESRAIVEGLNLRTRRTKSRKRGEKGQTVKVPAPLHLSNLQLWCDRCGRGRRVRAKVAGEKKFRVCVKCENVI